MDLPHSPIPFGTSAADSVSGFLRGSYSAGATFLTITVIAAIVLSPPVDLGIVAANEPFHCIVRCLGPGSHGRLAAGGLMLTLIGAMPLLVYCLGRALGNARVAFLGFTDFCGVMLASAGLLPGCVCQLAAGLVNQVKSVAVARGIHPRLR